MWGGAGLGKGVVGEAGDLAQGEAGSSQAWRLFGCVCPLGCHCSPCHLVLPMKDNSSIEPKDSGEPKVSERAAAPLRGEGQRQGLSEGVGMREAPRLTVSSGTRVALGKVILEGHSNAPSHGVSYSPFGSNSPSSGV